MTGELASAINSLLSKGILKEIDDEWYKIRQNIPNQTGQSITQQINSLSKTGKAPEDLITKIEDMLTAPFKATASGAIPKGSNKNAHWPQLHRGGDNYNILKQATQVHKMLFNGKRWPALEHAFLLRKNTYENMGGDFVRPRTTIFEYLGNLREKWPEGERIVNNINDSMLINIMGRSETARRYIINNYELRHKIESHFIKMTINGIVRAVNLNRPYGTDDAVYVNNVISDLVNLLDLKLSNDSILSHDMRSTTDSPIITFTKNQIIKMIPREVVDYLTTHRKIFRPALEAMGI